jgi:hypothetical protein
VASVRPGEGRPRRQWPGQIGIPITATGTTISTELILSLVRRHRGLIVHTAEELFDRRTLTGEELDDVVGRSVHDIPINEAHLPPAEFRDPIERWPSEEQ